MVSGKEDPSLSPQPPQGPLCQVDKWKYFWSGVSDLPGSRMKRGSRVRSPEPLSLGVWRITGVRVRMTLSPPGRRRETKVPRSLLSTLSIPQWLSTRTRLFNPFSSLGFTVLKEDLDGKRKEPGVTRVYLILVASRTNISLYEDRT